jgi:hypothetical protein
MSQDFIPEDYVEHSVTNPVATVKAGSPVTLIPNNTVNVPGIKKGGSSGVQSQSVARNNLTSGSSILTIYSSPKVITNNANSYSNSLFPQTKPSPIIAKSLPPQGTIKTIPVDQNLSWPSPFSVPPHKYFPVIPEITNQSGQPNNSTPLILPPTPSVPSTGTKSPWLAWAQVPYQPTVLDPNAPLIHGTQFDLIRDEFIRRHDYSELI